jgi:hypothetical protein
MRFWPFRGRQAKGDLDGVHGILKRHKKARSKHANVTWLPELTGNIRRTEDAVVVESELEIRDRWLPILRVTRLASLT